jgi:hypothetical protein
VISLEATIEVFTKGYKRPVENNYETFDGTRKYFHIAIDDEKTPGNWSEDQFWSLLEEAVRQMQIGSGLPGETRSPEGMAFKNY